MDRRREQTRRVALLGMLFALAMVLSWLEGLVTPLLGLPPGVKPGLANIVVMYALLFLGGREALALTVLKSGFVLLVQGGAAGLLSLAGGVCALAVMAAVGKWARPTLFIRSVCGAVFHNLGQLAMVNLLLTRSVYTWYYLPVLLVSGLIMGALTSLSLKAVLPALGKMQGKISDKKYQ